MKIMRGMSREANFPSGLPDAGPVDAVLRAHSKHSASPDVARKPGSRVNRVSITLLHIRLSKSQVLQDGESVLLAALKAANASPFLGQHELPERCEKSLHGNCLDEDPTAVLEVLFELYPAATVALIAKLAREFTGKTGQREFYPHLENYFDHSFTAAERRRLHDAFCAACLKLGLTVLSRDEHRTAHAWGNLLEYLLQGGPSDMALSALATACLEIERELGLADRFDPEGVSFWQEMLRERLDGRGQTMLARVLAEDLLGWHALCFARLRSGDAPVLPFERRFNDALQHAPVLDASSLGKMGPTPFLVYSDGEILLATPPVIGWTWAVRGSWDGDVLLRPAEEMPISTEAEVTVTSRRVAVDSETIMPRSIRLWAGKRLLCFEGRMGQRRDRDVPAGLVHVAACESFRIGQRQSEPQASGLWTYTLSLADGEMATVAFADGYREEIRARAEPSLDWEAGIITELDRAPVLSGTGVVLRLTLPVSSIAAWRGGLEVLLKTPAGILVRSAVQLDESGTAIVLSQLPHTTRFDRLSAVLVRFGEDRPLLRARGAWIWPGLAALRDGVFVGPTPVNFDAAASTGVAVGTHGLATVSHTGPKNVLAFSRQGAGSYRFSLPRQGVHAELEDASGRREVELGCVVVDDGTPRFLRVTSDDPDASLAFGATIIPRAFVGSGVRRVQLHSVTDANGEGRVEIQYPGAAARTCLIARVTQPFTPLDPAFTLLGGQTWIEFELREPVNGYELVGVELSSGERTTLHSNDGVKEMTIGRRRRIGVEPKRLFDGVWLFEIRALPGRGREPRALRLPRGDHFGLLVKIVGGYSVNIPILEHLPGIWNAVSVFERVNRAMAICWAEACWAGGLNRLDQLWLKTGRSVAERAGTGDQTALSALVKAIGITPPPGAGPTWLPMRHSIEVWPDLFGSPRPLLTDLLAEAEDEGVRNLAALLASPASDGNEGRDRHNDACRRFVHRIVTVGRAANNEQRLSGAAWLCKQADLEAERRRAPRRYPLLADHDAEGVDLVHSAPAFFSGLALASRHAAVANWLTQLTGSTDVGLALRQTGLLCRLGPELLAWHLCDVDRR